MKFLVRIGAALLVALGIGWVWGASARSEIARAVHIAEQHDSLLEGRAAVLDARLDFYSVNFGAGLALEGATLREDLDDNARLYGKKLAAQVHRWPAVAKRRILAPVSATMLLGPI
jgi:hypothetical protein